MEGTCNVLFVYGNPEANSSKRGNPFLAMDFYQLALGSSTGIVSLFCAKSTLIIIYAYMCLYMNIFNSCRFSCLLNKILLLIFSCFM